MKTVIVNRQCDHCEKQFGAFIFMSKEQADFEQKKSKIIQSIYENTFGVVCMSCANALIDKIKSLDVFTVDFRDVKK